VSDRRGATAPLFLVGFMGAGKTTIGGALAAQLGFAFEDTDAIVERAQGRTIDALIRDSGEGRFREAEWEALRSIAGRERVVVATGGGLFLGVAQRALVRACGLSCWIDAPLSIVASRVAPDTRPLWPADDALAQRALFERRRATYALADLRVDASRGSPEELARAVATERKRLLR